MSGNPLERASRRMKSVPEQIADEIAVRIVNGEYHGGEPLREQELALLYGVSRGPVREAIHELEKRGLVEIFPRRGAFVVSLTVDAVADVFNIRATLMGLAVRYLAIERDPEGLEELRQRAEELERLAARREIDPHDFAPAVWRMSATITFRCHNEHLARMLRNQLRHSLWGVLWRDEPLDYLTGDRRQELAKEYLALVGAIRAGHALEAEKLQRRILFRSRNHVVAVMARLRGETVDSSRLLDDEM